MSSEALKVVYWSGAVGVSLGMWAVIVGVVYLAGSGLVAAAEVLL